MLLLTFVAVVCYFGIITTGAQKVAHHWIEGRSGHEDARRLAVYLSAMVIAIALPVIGGIAWVM